MAKVYSTLLGFANSPQPTGWDDSFGEFEMGSYSFTASEILFYVDNKAYMSEQQAFVESENESIN